MVHRILSVLVLVVPGLTQAQQITLWTTEEQPERLEVQNRIAADFEAETGIAVEVVPVTTSDLAQRTTAAFAAGDLPDVIYHPVSHTAGWAQEGILDTFAASDVVAALGEDTFRQGVLDLVAFQGDHAAVPHSGWTQLLLYRQDLFEEAGLEPPTDYDSIRAAIEALHAPEEMYGFVAPTDPSDPYMMEVLEHLSLANGVRLVDEEGNVSLDTPAMVETLEFYRDLAEASPPGNLHWEHSRELYFAGRAAMVVWSPFILDELGGLRDEVPVPFDAEGGQGSLADVTGIVSQIAGPSNEEGASWASVNVYGITMDADTEAATRFVEYSMSDAYIDTLGIAAEGTFPLRTGPEAGSDEYVRGWSELEVGVDRGASLAELYGEEVVQDIVAGLDRADRWGFARGQGALVSALYGTRVMADAVRAFLDGERDAEATAEHLQQEVEALQE